MTGIIIGGGRERRLPVLFSWSVLHTSGNAADGFDLTCPYNADMLAALESSSRFRGEYKNETVFSGVIDEYEVIVGQNGRTLRISGRGMAALLMDNESEAVEYQNCSMDTILDNHVRPAGITDISCDINPVCGVFAVGSGLSQWKTLYEFCKFSAGVTPSFSKTGALVISNKPGVKRKLGPGAAASEMRLVSRRYGVISEALVKNPVAGTSDTVRNDEFIARGGNSRRVILVPRHTSYDWMRATAAYQIASSKEESFYLEVRVPALFAAFPADIADVSYESLGINGEFAVAESECYANSNGYGTVLKLVPAQSKRNGMY
jgi:prophage tail gpP-like protein